MRATILLLSVLLSACTSIANLKDLPASSADIDFDEVSARSNDAADAEVSADYLTSVEAASAEQLVGYITEALRDNGYTLAKTDRANGVVFAERGLQANEYGSVAGVYYQAASGAFSVYARRHYTGSNRWLERESRQADYRPSVRTGALQTPCDCCGRALASCRQCTRS